MSAEGHSVDIKKLQREWYKKLKDEDGFEDIEDTNHPGMPLKTWHSHKWKNTPPEKFAATEIYYDKARELLNTYEFESPTHLKIWELHCDGLSKRKIEKVLSQEAESYKRESIGLIIQLIASTIK